MNSRTSAAESSSPFRLRSISFTACIGASLFLGIDQEALRERDLPLLAAQPALGLVEQPLDLALLARDTRSRDARALPGVVVVDLRDGSTDAVLKLRLRGAEMMALLLQRVRLRKVELARENSDQPLGTRPFNPIRAPAPVLRPRCARHRSPRPSRP